MNKEEILYSIKEIDAEISALHSERRKIISQYIECNRQFQNGEVVNVHGKIKGVDTERQAYVSNAYMHESNGDIYYALKAVKANGLMSMQSFNRRVYDHEFTLHKIINNNSKN